MGPKINTELNKGHRRKDDGIPVQIRVFFRGKTVRVATNIVAYPADLSRSGKLKGLAAEKANDLVQRMRAAANSISWFDLQDADAKTVTKTIEAKMTEGKWNLDFFAWSEEFMVTHQMAAATRGTYRTAVSALRRFVGVPYLDINAITVPFLQDFIAFLQKEPRQHYAAHSKELTGTSKPKHAGTVDRLYLAKLSTIFSAARSRFNDDDLGIIRIPRDSFRKVFIPEQAADGQQALPENVLWALIRDETESPAMRRALDAAILSLGLCGANMADLYTMVPPEDGIVKYYRQKTTRRRLDKAEMRIRLPEQMVPVAARLSRGAVNGHWLALSRHYSTPDNATRGVNKLLAKWAGEHGFKPFTFYAVRKTWASIAHSKCGIDKATIDECLVHVGTHEMADIYIMRDWTLLWAANQKVMDYIFGK